MKLCILGSAAACRLSGDIVQRFSAIDSGARVTRQIFPIFFTLYAGSREACFRLPPPHDLISFSGRHTLSQPFFLSITIVTMASDTLDAVEADPSVAASGDEGTGTEEAAAPNEARSNLKRMAAISVWNSVLLHVNEILLPGFARHHIGRLARSVAPGLRVEVQTAWGSRIPSTIILRLQIRNGDDISDFAVINLPIGQTKLPLTAEISQSRLETFQDYWTHSGDIFFHQAHHYRSCTSHCRSRSP